MADLQPTDQPKQPRTKKSGCFWALVFVGVLVLVDIVGILLGSFLPWLQVMMGGPEVHRGVGQTLTFLELEPLTGNPPSLSLSALQGHVTLLNFWGTWCPPCRAELPHVAELWRRFAGREAFRLAAISYPPGGQGGDPQLLHNETTTLLEQLHLDLPTYYDSDSKTLTAVDQTIGFEGFPTNVLLDRQGVIRAIWVGYWPGVETQIERFVDKLLGEMDKERKRQ